eukprot:353330-Chlamydomonas_euryale.AAC.3
MDNVKWKNCLYAYEMTLHALDYLNANHYNDIYFSNEKCSIDVEFGSDMATLGLSNYKQNNVWLHISTLSNTCFLPSHLNNRYFSEKGVYMEIPQDDDSSIGIHETIADDWDTRLYWGVFYFCAFNSPDTMSNLKSDKISSNRDYSNEIQEYKKWLNSLKKSYV